MKILLLSCKTGGGHDAAANALKEEFIAQGHEAFVFDYLTLAGEKVAKRVADFYVKTVQTAPQAFGYAYNLALFVGKHVKRSPIYYFNRKMIKFLTPYLKAHRYDAIVCTHLYPMETLTAMIRENIPLPPCIGVMTDYTVIPFICETDVDEYIIPHPDLAAACENGGLNGQKLHPFGIPYSPRILLDVSKTEAKKQLALDESKKTVLLIGGSMGAGNLVALADAFAADDRTAGAQTVIICGNNRAVKYKILKKYLHDKRFKVLGHTDKMPLFMKAADVIYTKPGGLTSTETAASRTPLVITYPIPGCETANKQFYLSHGMAVSADTPQDLVNAGFELISSPEKEAAMIKAQEENVSASATKNSVDFILSLIEKRKKQAQN